jgi:hypothetical protein
VEEISYLCGILIAIIGALYSYRAIYIIVGLFKTKKFKPAKNQRIHQQYFLPKEQVLRVNAETGKNEKQDVVAIRSASARGKQLTTKPISRISSSKGSWWSDSEPPSKGVID